MRSIRNVIKMALAVAAVTLATGQKSWAVLGDFTYTTLVTPASLQAQLVPPPFSSVTQGSVLSSPTINANLGVGTDILVGTITVSDNATALGAQTDTYAPQAINVQLSITDAASSLTGVFNFAGTISGTVATNGSTDAVNFNNPFVLTTKTLVIGGVTYTVTIDPTKDFTAPGAPPGAAAGGGSGLAGTYSFHVFASNSIPEPASMTLMGIGVLGMVGFVARRRRAR